MEKKLREYIRGRIAYVTAPVNYAYGYVTNDQIYDTLCELQAIAEKVLGDWDLHDEIKAIKMKYYPYPTY